MDLEKSWDNFEKLTDESYWDCCYRGRELVPFDERDWKNYVSVQLFRLVETLSLDGKRVCEVGGGDAKLLVYLAKRHPSSRFCVLDFSPLGCEFARRRAEREGVILEVYQEDMFSPSQALVGSFDLVLSYGVVEHFTDLSRALMAKGRLLKVGGLAFTLIPNLASPVYAGLFRYYSRTVYRKHIPHTMASFLRGHRLAGLVPLRRGYLGSVEFGMISMAVEGPEPTGWWGRQFYLLLTRISKVVHFLEYRFMDFPATSLFSPFMYVISRREG